MVNFGWVKFGADGAFLRWGRRVRRIGGGEGVVKWSKWSKWSFGHLVKIDFGQTENATIIIKIYFYYYSEQQTHLENENDQNDLDHFDHICSYRYVA